MPKSATPAKRKRTPVEESSLAKWCRDCTSQGCTEARFSDELGNPNTLCENHARLGRKVMLARTVKKVRAMPDPNCSGAWDLIDDFVSLDAKYRELGMKLEIKKSKEPLQECILVEDSEEVEEPLQEDSEQESHGYNPKSPIYVEDWSPVRCAQNEEPGQEEPVGPGEPPQHSNSGKHVTR